MQMGRRASTVEEVWAQAEEALEASSKRAEGLLTQLLSMAEDGSDASLFARRHLAELHLDHVGHAGPAQVGGEHRSDRRVVAVGGHAPAEHELAAELAQVPSELQPEPVAAALARFLGSQESTVQLEEMGEMLKFEVIDTGIGMRNTHMRENHLETEQYPLAVFTGQTVVATSAPALSAGNPVELTVRGAFDLHGVSQPRDITAQVTLEADGSLSVVAQFPVSLEDHEIKRPKFLVMKLADEQQVRVSLTAYREES